jgi:S-adenosylmethionine hydrolase
VDRGLSRITLLTDFGSTDGYVAAMRGVIASTAPGAVVEDASHDIPPGDVYAAAWALGRYWRLYPEGTIHIVVVDPGVGGARRALAAECAGRFLVAPDNGVLTHAFVECESKRVVAIENAAHMRQPVSATFHGRDIFAPAAAYLANGGKLEALGNRVADPILLPWPKATQTRDAYRGEVMHVDRFGNLITNVPARALDNAESVVVAGNTVSEIGGTYSAVEPGGVLALVGSADLVEIAVRDGNAAEALAVGRGAKVVVVLRASAKEK